ncbi:uncharacterized protein LOC119190008 [Manduca sexta]|uniref:uncharacterized protein LOC119190008 n=1 Tax=Manduca sexta TaxID=7130 RepID=UPI00188DC7E8|nr:uncharacterized protein LOC119190008 [Manduca sexta]
MTFLSVVIFGSLFYLSQCMPTDMIPPIPEVTMPNYQEQMEGFMKDMTVAAENHLQPLMAQLDPSDQQQVVEYGINSFINYIDYMIHIITANEDAKIAQESATEAEDDDDYLYDDDYERGKLLLSK